MKALIIAADAATPDYIIEKSFLFPNINRMIGRGAACTYSAYVQKGYTGSYSSEQNWASVYTGLAPMEHQINNKGSKLLPPKMEEFNGLRPFWQLLNETGLTVGLWSAYCCNDPVEINGYAVSCRYEPIFTPSENREAPRKVTVCEKDKRMLRFLDGTPPPRLYPRTLKQQGFTFHELKTTPELIDKIANEQAFQAILDNFDSELRFWFAAMAKAQRESPVDVIYLFTPTTDILAHFSLYCDENPVLIKAYLLLDRYIGEFVREFCPEITVFMSDHGQQNFKYLIQCSDSAIQREAFDACDNVVWMKNGYIAFEAQNGGLLFTAHSLKGVFIACGSGIRHTKISEMRTLDVYPTLLELFGIKVPPGRIGHVVEIFDKPIVNAEKLLKEDDVRYKNIALIQTHKVSVTDIILNELYIENRFARITVAGEPKYEEIFRNNPRVFDFIAIEHFNADGFDEVYCGFYNETTKLMRHIRVK